jgi:hypothetical protein
MREVLKQAIYDRISPIYIGSLDLTSDIDISGPKEVTKDSYREYFRSDEYFSGNRVILIQNIEQNQSIQDFLLKIIEEDRINVFLIYSSDICNLSEPIKSRIRLKIYSDNKVIASTDYDSAIKFFKDPNWYERAVCGDIPDLFSNKNVLSQDHESILRAFRYHLPKMVHQRSVLNILSALSRTDYDRLKHFILSEAILNCNI